MSEQKSPYIDVAKHAEAGYVDASQNPTSTSTKEGAHAASNPSSETPPPPYREPASSSSTQDQNARPPINHQSLEQDVSNDMRGLAEGDPDEVICVPMIHSTEKKSIKAMFLREVGKVSQTVVVRKMPRRHYLKHYAKDSEGNYIGTEKPAADAGLVFVPSKGTPDDLLQQVRKVAFGKEHYASSFGSSYSGAAGGAFGGGF